MRKMLDKIAYFVIRLVFGWLLLIGIATILAFFDKYIFSATQNGNGWLWIAFSVLAYLIGYVTSKTGFFALEEIDETKEPPDAGN